MTSTPIAPASEPSSGRRTVLFRVLLSIQAACVALAALPLLRVVLAPLRRGGGDDGWDRAGALLDFADGKTVAVRYRRRWRDGYREASTTATAIVTRRGSTITALSATCTHLGCLVHLDPARSELACPCHGGRFALDGAVLAGPPPRPLAALEVKQEDASVWLRSPRGPA